MKTAYSYVRFSSKPQELGDSLRRQIGKAREYAQAHDMVLDDRSYRDLGISAFRGKNASEGALGAFLKAVDGGLIAEGSYLLVESLDRVSRAAVLDAFDLFRSIIKRGIVLVTLLDKQTYSRESIDGDWTKLIMALAVMARATNESETKSALVKAAWQAKREKGEILTSIGPAWLKLNEARTKWILIPEKVAVVKKVFQYAMNGLGGPTIANKLNEGAVPTMATAPFWEPGVVQAILKNSAVTGLYTPKKADAPPIEGYYPTIIKPEVFHTVQEHIAKRRGSGGRKGTNVANLFAGLVRCSCGARVRFVSANKPHLYLRCTKAYSNMGCDAPTIPYNVLEDEILQMLLVWGTIETDGTQVTNPLVVLNGELESAKAKLARWEKVVNEAEDVAAPAVVLRNLVQAEAEVKRIEHDIKHMIVPAPISEVVQGTLKLWAQHKNLKAKGGDELRDLRYKLQAEFKRMLTKIVLPLDYITTEFNGKPVQHMSCVLYGPVVEANALDVDKRYFTKDGGWELTMLLPPFGINGTRRRTKR